MDPWAEFFSSLRFTDIGAAGLLSVAVILILLGKLVPKSVADAWRDAYFKEREASSVKDAQITDLSAAARVTARALDSLPQGGGEPDAATTTETRRRREQG